MRIKSVVVLAVAFLIAGAVGFQFVGLRIHLSPAVPDRTIEIGIETTATASVAAGVAILNGAEFAIARAGSVRGFNLKFVVYDDSELGAYSPDRGVGNAEAMLADGRLLGVVGPVFSPVASAMIPIANQAHLAIISPTTSVQCLTVSVASCPENWRDAALRPTGKNNFFRIAASETFRGAAMADFAYDALALRRVAVWSDREPPWEWSATEADGFSSEFTRKGGLVVTRKYVDNLFPADPADTLPAMQSDFHDWLIQARDARAEAVYSGAPSSWPGCEQWASLGEGVFDPGTYYLGSDSGPDPTASGGYPQYRQCIADALSLETGRVYASSDIADARLNPAAAGIIAAYRRAHPAYDPSTFAGYDCAAILIAAIRRAIDVNHGRRPTRQQVVDQVASTRNFHGTTGSYTFSADGDPTQPTVAILQLSPDGGTARTNVTVGS
jgi:branched-chain amino acid transport system substrate-binding protein